MNRKQLLAVLCGVFAAGLLCLIVGLIVYFTAHGKVLSLIMGLITIAFGSIMAAIAAIVLAVIGIIALISHSKNKDKQ